MSGYVINVAAKNAWGLPRHIFRTAKDSILTEERARQVASDLREAYPFDNYSISITLWSEVGTEIEADYGEAEE